MDAEDRELIDSLQFASPEEQLSGWRYIAEKYPDDIVACLNYAQSLLDAGELTAARQACERVLARLGRVKQVVAQLALVVHAEGDDAGAFDLADEAIALGYRWAPVLALRGTVMQKLGELDSAASAFLEAYLEEPHAWDCLRQYCQLTGREYHAPNEEPLPVLGPLTRAWLYHFVDDAAHTPDASGNVPGCDHTLRFVRCWCRLSGHDEIDIYQYLNAQGGFCDCEVIFNVEARDVAFGRFAIHGGTLTSAPRFREILLEAGTVLETDTRPALVLDDVDNYDDDDDDDDDPVLIAANVDRLMLFPQLASGRAWGALAHSVVTRMESAVTFCAVAIAPDDDRSRWAWSCVDGSISEWRLPADLSPALSSVVNSGLEALAAVLPDEPSRTWIEAVSLLPERPNLPRLLSFGGGSSQRMSYADGSETIAPGLTSVFHVAPSPDGAHIAFVQQRRAREILVIVNVATGIRRLVLEAPHFSDHLYWLGAGELLVQSSLGWRIVDVDGTLRAIDTAGPPSPDGRSFAAERDGKLVITSRTGEIELSHSHPGTVWSWSPDGQCIALTAVEGVGHRVYLWDLTTNAIQPLTGKDSSSYWPCFTSDGLSVVIDHVDGEPGTAPCRIARVSLADAALHFLSDGPLDSRPRSHPTLPWIAWQRRDPIDRSQTAICAVGPDGTLIVHEGRGSEATWWPS